MEVQTNEYHPYAACLMFKACGNARDVRLGLTAVYQYGYTQGHYKGRMEAKESTDISNVEEDNE